MRLLVQKHSLFHRSCFRRFEQYFGASVKTWFRHSGFGAQTYLDPNINIIDQNGIISSKWRHAFLVKLLIYYWNEMEPNIHFALGSNYWTKSLIELIVQAWMIYQICCDLLLTLQICQWIWLIKGSINKAIKIKLEKVIIVW